MYFKDSGIDWIGHIPEHWRVEKLKRILECPLMYGTNEVAESDDTFKSLPPDKADGYYLDEGDVLFARSGATVGKTFLFKGYDGKACFAGYLIKAQTNKQKLLPEYLYYFTKSPPTFKVEVQQKQKRLQVVFCSPGIFWACC
jgi:type I restriction enzyme S subunit